jgi:hypothetical protein
MSIRKFILILAIGASWFLQLKAQSTSVTPCADLNDMEQRNLGTFLASYSSGDLVGPLAGGMIWNNSIKECAWQLARECPNGGDKVICEKARSAQAPLYLIQRLLKEEGACRFLPKAAEIVKSAKNRTTGARWCLRYVMTGGDDQCLIQYKPEILAALVDGKSIGNSERDGLLTGFLGEMAFPRHQKLLPWLKSLPKPKSAHYAESLKLAVAVQEKDKETLLCILSTKKTMETSYLSAPELTWLVFLFPETDVVKEAKARGASKSDLDWFRLMTSKPNFKDVIKNVTTPSWPYCEPGTKSVSTAAHS